jgi:hypothetical protein
MKMICVEQTANACLEIDVTQRDENLRCRVPFDVLTTRARVPKKRANL